MKLDLWKPLKINNPLLKDIFNIPIDGKVLPNGKIQVHPLIILGVRLIILLAWLIYIRKIKNKVS